MYISHFTTLNLKGKNQLWEHQPQVLVSHSFMCCVGTALPVIQHLLSAEIPCPLTHHMYSQGTYQSFTACGVGYPMILPLLKAWKWAVKIPTMLRMWIQPWESLILALWDWLVWVFVLSKEATAAFAPTAASAGQSPTGGHYWGFHVQLPISQLKISLVFVRGAKSFIRAGYTSVCPRSSCSPGRRAHLKALGHKTQQKLSIELHPIIPVGCSQLRIFNDSLKHWVAHTFLCLLLLQAARRCCA